MANEKIEWTDRKLIDVTDGQMCHRYSSTDVPQIIWTFQTFDKIIFILRQFISTRLNFDLGIQTGNAEAATDVSQYSWLQQILDQRWCGRKQP